MEIDLPHDRAADQAARLDAPDEAVDEAPAEAARPDAPAQVVDGAQAEVTLAAVDQQDAPESVIDAVEALLDEVEGALSRLDDGTYGRCSTCDESIEDAFLAEMPTTQSCPACSSTAAG